MAQDAIRAHIDVEQPADYFPAIIADELRRIRANLSQKPENADYLSLSLNPGQILKVYGFDATRASMQLTASAPGVFVGNGPNWPVGYTGVGSISGFPIPSTSDATLTLENLGEVWLFNSNDGENMVTVSVLTERYSAV